LNKRRFYLIGILIALILATRLTAGIAAALFVFFSVLLDDSDTQRKIRSTATLFAPIGIGMLLLGVYNYARFESCFSTGYSEALIAPQWLMIHRDTAGLFNIINIPRNFYYYFLAPPMNVSSWGLSFFVLGPIYFKIFLGQLYQKKFLPYWISSAVLILLFLSYFTTGFLQFGPRYTLDFLPLIFVLLLFSFKDSKVSKKYHALIFTSSYINLILFLAFSFS